jgi:hypothetical protein
MTTQEKVIAKLISYGNNIEDVKEMVKLHFEYASSTYKTVSQIAECIRIIY